MALKKRAAAPRFAGIGRIWLWQGGSLWVGRDVGQARPHAHHAIQISMALEPREGGFRMRGGEGDWSAYDAAIVMPHRRHEFDGRRGWITQIFVEPETERGRALIARFGSADVTRLVPLDPATVAELRRGHALLAAGERIVDALAGSMPARAPTDARIAAAIDFISRRMAAGSRLGDVARAVHLSPGRLRHLFVQETGTTYRGYVLWLRINRAVAAMMDGRSWTEAAHEAGFADSAHLSRMFRRMFGISPNMIVRNR